MIRKALFILILLTLSCYVYADDYLLKDDFQSSKTTANYSISPDKAWQWLTVPESNRVLAPVDGSAGIVSLSDLNKTYNLQPGYTLKMSMRYTDVSSAPARIVLLAQDRKKVENSDEEQVYGYELRPVSENGALVLQIYALYPDKKPKRIDNMSSGNWNNVDLTKWFQLTSTVQILSSATTVTFEWEGKDKEGETVSYTVNGRDSSPERYTQGEAFVLRTVKEANGLKSAYLFDSISITKMPTPQPPVIPRRMG